MNDLVWPLMRNNIDRQDLDAVIKYLEQDDPKLTHGEKVGTFETSWSRWLGVNYSVMVNSGSSANDLTMLALREMYGVGEVIVPALTWVSDIASVLHAGHQPIFVDINPRTLGLDCEQVIKTVTKNTKAVFLTHVLGFNALTNDLVEELENLGVLLIEDVCESHGATYGGRKLGTFGWASNFSFYYAHHMTTIEGGIISTNDSNLYDVTRMMRSHGLVRESKNRLTKEKYINEYPDLNSDFIFAYYSHNMRPTEINGILGLSQLERLDSNIVLRRKNFEIFLDNLNPRLFFKDFALEENSNYAFVLILKEGNLSIRNKVENVLRGSGVEFRRGLSGGGNQLRQPYIKRFPNIPEPNSLPNTEYVHHFAWYIGNHPNLKAEEILWLCQILNNIKD